MQINKLSPVPAGTYYGCIRDIKIKNCKNAKGEYQEITYYLLLEFDEKTELITPKVFKSTFPNCSYNILLKNLKECFYTKNIDIMEHRGLNIVVEIELKYINGKEIPNILWYMTEEEYYSRIAMDSYDETNPDDD